MKPPWPRRPRFATVDEERLHRKQRLAAAFRVFAKLGYDDGIAGHLTARDPEFPDRYWVNPFGVPFAHLRVSDLQLVDHTGEIIEGSRPVNEAAFAIHAAVHAARPDVVGACHAHSIHGKAFSALGIPLDPITQDACAFYQHHGVFADYTGLVFDPEEGKRIAAALGGGKGVILRNHGLLTVGTTVDSAAWWFIAMERAAEVQLRAMAAGLPVRIRPEEAATTFSQSGTEWFGWMSFQPVYEVIVREQPDLLT